MLLDRALTCTFNGPRQRLRRRAAHVSSESTIGHRVAHPGVRQHRRSVAQQSSSSIAAATIIVAAATETPKSCATKGTASGEGLPTLMYRHTL